MLTMNFVPKHRLVCTIDWLFKSPNREKMPTFFSSRMQTGGKIQIL